MLACERHGVGEPLVLLHGVLHRRQVWYPVLDRLAEHHEVILVDLPGHGESDPFVPAGLPATDAMCRDLTEFFLEQGLERPHVAGNSLGGLLALLLASQGAVGSVSCLSPAGFWDAVQDAANIQRACATFLAMVDRIGPRAEHMMRIPSFRRTFLRMTVEQPRQVPLEHVLGDVRAFFTARAAFEVLLAAPMQAGELVIDPAIPITIAWAAKDRLLPVQQAEIARERLPQAEHIIMPKVGHIPTFDNPSLVADILLRGTQPTATVAPLQYASPQAAARQRSARRPAAAAG